MRSNTLISLLYGERENLDHIKIKASGQSKALPAITINAAAAQIIVCRLKLKYKIKSTRPAFLLVEK